MRSVNIWKKVQYRGKNIIIHYHIKMLYLSCEFIALENAI